MTDPAPLLVRALRGEVVERVPAWIMRQAGRYLPEYRELRAKHDFLSCCTTPDLAAEITLQPMRRFPLDGAILFADIMTPLHLAGVPMEFSPGPKLAAPVRDRASAETLGDPVRLRKALEAGHFREIFGRIRAGLPEGAALLGFAGSPFTVACYAVEGGGGKGEFHAIRRMSHIDPAALHALLERITALTAEYLLVQASAGADALQIFDSWGGILSPTDYRRWSLPWVKRLVEMLAPTGVPIILYAGGAGPHLAEAASIGVSALSIDHRETMGDVRRRVGHGVTLQGNLDPAALFGSEEALRTAVVEVLRSAGTTRTVFNLGHGIWPDTDPAAVALVLKVVREESERILSEVGAP